MRIRVRSALTYSNVISTLCLFVVLGGGAYAASSGLIDGAKLKPRSVTGSKIKKDSLTGREIKESKLGRVPDSSRLGGKRASSYLTTSGTAANAAKLGGQAPSAYLAAGATAADAAKLGGKDPSAYVGTDRLVTGSGVTSAVPAQTVLTYPPLGLTVTTDGDADSNSDVTIVNNGPVSVEVSRSTSNTVTVIGHPASTTFTLPGTARVEDFVIRPGSAGDSTKALSLTCGFDFAPDIMNCVGIGIG
jgi:hypothetical protein